MEKNSLKKQRNLCLCVRVCVCACVCVSLALSMYLLSYKKNQYNSKK